MNKLLLLGLLLFSTTISAQKIDKNQWYIYSDAVEFRVVNVGKSRFYEKGNTTYYAEKGERFFKLIFEFKNKTSEEQEIDFEKIFILDPDDYLHNAEQVLMNLKVTTNPYKLQHKIKANKKRKIIAVFVPPLPKTEIIKRLVINDEIYELDYN
ncbi:hypothetical protein [Psychroserpens sp.]|uniref:hypothetical protein n=1 Tax=Psychroserpens sp. TaxID=2020870 RepID=UPI001AFD21DD|nr:hypothetical protein [Psychroserpens sp.]MBO6605213.1 hypothetical protein [Psychroserpens sp.]MBO6630153.1 hypothetical protein [Psychroserpens sp.]MBO6653978.1 hypothetical protein [Psychroserpens sp.]MBO6682299.1 hypothetical protein [Psychroserpens sp.]MBO6748587.1 hypothetical protein [Psychroserpens sp.]